MCWHLPIFPGRRQPSIFGTIGLNFCVRYGNRWTPYVINTNFIQTANNYKLFVIHHSFFTEPCVSKAVLVTRAGIEQELRS